MEPKIYSSLAGCDIKCVFSIPASEGINGISLEWATVQTMSVSSARTVVQVRGLGTPIPLGITRGARTYAGSLVFASMDKDQLYEAARKLGEGSTWFYDELPPFNITILGANEYGHTLKQVLYNVVLTNWGTTYSVDDLMTEQTYTYIASEATPVQMGAVPLSAEEAILAKERAAEAYFADYLEGL